LAAVLDLLEALSFKFPISNSSCRWISEPTTTLHQLPTIN
jgi:hypothetical protein